MNADTVDAVAAKLRDVTELRGQLWANGYRPVSVYSFDAQVKSAGKRPVGEGWHNEARRDSPLWATHPAEARALNTGILCDGLRVIDVDIEDSRLAHEVGRLAEQRLGITLMRFRSNSARLLLVYRAETGSPRKRVKESALGKIEVLGHGNQFVAFGTHPSGAAIEWVLDSPLDTARNDIRSVSEEAVTDFLEAAGVLIGAKATSGTPSSGTAAPGKTAADLAPPDAQSVVDLLEALPNNLETDRDAYIAVLLAAKGCIDGLEAVDRLGDDDAERIRDAAVAWAGKWPACPGEDVEAARWDDDIAKRDRNLAGWSNLLHRAASAGVEVWPWQNAAAADEFEAEDEPEGGETRAVSHARMLDRLVFPTDCETGQRRGYLIKRLIAPGDVGAIIGAPSAGKSMLAPYLAYAVAQGRSVFGLRTKQGRTLYAAAEDFVGMRQRVHALMRQHGDAPEFALAYCGSLRDRANSLDLLAAVREWRPALVVIDTLGAAWAGLDENSAQDMGEVVALARRIAGTGVAVLIVHHTAKHGDGTPRGHSVLNGTLDVSLRLEPKDENGVIRGKLGKNRNGGTDLDIAFRPRVVVLGQDEDGDAITAPIVDEMAPSAAPRSAGRPLSEQQAATLQKAHELMASDGEDAPDGGRGVPLGQLIEATTAFYEAKTIDGRRRSARRAIATLVQRGRLEASGDLRRPVGRGAAEFGTCPSDGESPLAGLVDGRAGQVPDRCQGRVSD